MLARTSSFGSVAMSRSIGERGDSAEAVANGMACRIVLSFVHWFFAALFSLLDSFFVEKDDFNMPGRPEFGED